MNPKPNPNSINFATISTARSLISEARRRCYGGTLTQGIKQFVFSLLFYKELCDVYDVELSRAVAETGGEAQAGKAAKKWNYGINIELGKIYECD